MYIAKRSGSRMHLYDEDETADVDDAEGPDGHR
jgi:hypothetical protein